MKIYFIGIGGVSMSAIAKFLFYKGFLVEGSDKIVSEFTNDLNKLGVSVYIPNNELALSNADVVIVNSAISSENIELKLAKKLKKPIYERAEILNEILKCYNNSIGVSGSHGKTTVTSMIAHILNESKIPFVSHIGGIDKVLSNLHFDKNAEFMVSEICEYKKNILKTKVSQSVILNIDNDHLDCYGSIDNLIDAFKTFSNNSNINFYNGDDFNLKTFKGISFGFSNGVDYQAINLTSNHGAYSYKVRHKGKILSTITLKVNGKHNVLNSLCAFTVAHYNGIDASVIKRSLENFSDVSRRNEFLYKIGNVDVFADYCHHPTEIKNYISTVKEKYKNPLFVFEPHTYSRTKILFNDFKNVLKNETVLVYKTYPAREKFDKEGSSLKLSSVINKPHFSKFNYLFNYLIKNENKYDGIFILGAGSLYEKFKSKGKY